MALFACRVCGYEYDEDEGDIDHGIEGGTEFCDLSDDWTCPLCGASKEDFEEIAEELEEPDPSLF